MKIYSVIYQEINNKEFDNIAISNFTTLELAETKLKAEIEETKKVCSIAKIVEIDKNKFKFEAIGFFTGYWQIIESEVK